MGQQIYSRKYSQEILELLDYFPAVGIIGARQVGKTTMIELLKKEYKKPLHYIDLELVSDYEKLANPEIYLSMHKDKCIVIDEIQIMPELFPLLRALIDKNKQNGQFIILGSASPELLRQSSESLAGRIAYIETMPFTLDEIPEGISQQEHWLRGGFPKALFAPNDRVSYMWTDNFIKTYIERDLQLLGLKNEPVFLRRLWSMLAHSNGNILNYSTLAKSLSITVPTLQRYIDFFENTFLVKRIQPYFSNIKKRLVKSPKLYLTDTGILHNFIGVKSIEDIYGHPAFGNSWEAYCIMQILSAAPDGLTPYFFRTHDGAECDLVLMQGQIAKYAVEIKYKSGPKLTRGNTLAFSEINAENNIVIMSEGETYFIQEDTKAISLSNFIHEFKQ